MFSLNELFLFLDRKAPIDISKKMIEKGEYDNSGILVNLHDCVEKVLFSLDLSIESVKRAKKLKCDTIVTHHPAIYTPVKSLDINGENSALAMAIKGNINVISMHLNLDMSCGGIDENLALKLGANDCKVLEYLDEKHGYGREFTVNKKLSEIVSFIRKTFKTKRVIYYGNEKDNIVKASSYCGGGASFALGYVKNKITDSDLIITSDMPHHIIKELIDTYKKDIILLPHYTAENCGFKEFYAKTLKELDKNVEAYYFEDKRFI